MIITLISCLDNYKLIVYVCAVQPAGCIPPGGSQRYCGNINFALICALRSNKKIQQM